MTPPGETGRDRATIYKQYQGTLISPVEERRCRPESLHKVLVAPEYSVMPLFTPQPSNSSVCGMVVAGDSVLGPLPTLPRYLRPQIFAALWFFMSEALFFSSTPWPERPVDLNWHPCRPSRCHRYRLLYQDPSSSQSTPSPRVSTPVFQPTLPQEL